MFSCECCEIFKNTYFEEHLGTTASEIWQRSSGFFLNIKNHETDYMEECSQACTAWPIIINWMVNLYHCDYSFNLKEVRWQKNKKTKS